MIDESDPRVTGDCVRRISGSGGDGDVIVLGVVHGHPASTYRLRTVIDATDPGILALELPPLAIPLFEEYAEDTQTPPSSGGEMSAAIQASPSCTVVGIDGPTPGFLRRLVGAVYRSDIGVSTVRTIVAGVVSATKHALACRFAATSVGSGVFREPEDFSREYDCDWSDPPQQQAADERAQIRRATSVKNLFGESNAVKLRDAARETHMADRLRTLRKDGTVVAIVGEGHLDPLADRLREGSESSATE